MSGQQKAAKQMSIYAADSVLGSNPIQWGFKLQNVANSWAFRFAMSSPSGAGPRTWVLEQRKVPDKVTIYNSVGLVDFATTLVFQSPTDKPTTS